MQLKNANTYGVLHASLEQFHVQSYVFLVRLRYKQLGARCIEKREMNHYFTHSKQQSNILKRTQNKQGLQ